MNDDAFARLFDDAAIFPPGEAPLDVAARNHAERDRTPEGAFVGPFVCDVRRVRELTGVVTSPMRVSLVGPADEVVAMLPRLAGSPVMIASIEVTGPLRARPDVPVPVAVEMPWGEGFDVPHGTVLKLRCGGACVPTADELGEAVRFCVARDRPFKLTAGLHAAVAHDGAHGFVNVMAATVAASRNRDPRPVLSQTADELDLGRLERSRRWFRSVGTCDIDEPLAGLRSLGLVA